jgi:hypothetical protein
MLERHCSRTPRDGDEAAPDLAEQDDADDAAVLGILIDSEHPGIWTAEEVMRALGGLTSVADSLMRLERDGLIHRLDRFVFPTRAAVRANEVQL